MLLILHQYNNNNNNNNRTNDNDFDLYFDTVFDAPSVYNNNNNMCVGHSGDIKIFYEIFNKEL